MFLGSSGLVQFLQKGVSRGSSGLVQSFQKGVSLPDSSRDISKGFSGLVQSSRRVVVTCTRVTVADAALVATLPKGNDPM